MPTLLVNESTSPRGQGPKLPLFDESGTELSLAGSVVADFLASADFSHIFEHPEVQPFIITVVDEDDENVTEEILPGAVVLKVMDEADVEGMFLHYLDLLGENAIAEDAILEDKLKLAVFETALLKPLDERFKKGAFRKMRKAEGGAQGRGSQVNMMLGAMIGKGEIKRAKKSGGGYKGGDYEKGSKYRTGPSNASKMKGKQVSRRMKSKNLRARQTSGYKRGSKRGRSLAASVGMEESFLFGYGESYSGALFQFSPREDATVEFTEAEFNDLKTRFAPCYDDAKTEKGTHGLRLVEATNEASDDLNESVANYGSVPGAGAVGMRDLSEGASLARDVLRITNPKTVKTA